MIWQDLATPAVRDLAWACFSPSLLLSPALHSAPFPIGNCSLALTGPRREWLQQLDREPAALLDELSQSHSTRLGVYFEKLWLFLLRADPDIDLIAHNLPVREGGRTLGEFDCIYFCRQRSRPVHLELAVKFYLEVEGTPRWLGPGRRDSLEQKLDRLLGHQIRLSRTDQGRRALEALGVHEPLPEIELKGYLFGHSEQPALPAGYNARCPLSSWLPWRQFLEGPAEALAIDSWLDLPRLRWLAPCDRGLEGYAALEPVTAVSLARHFERSNRPLLLAGCGSDGRERQRCFVTPEHWPRS